MYLHSALPAHCVSKFNKNQSISHAMNIIFTAYFTTLHSISNTVYLRLMIDPILISNSEEFCEYRKTNLNEILSSFFYFFFYKNLATTSILLKIAQWLIFYPSLSLPLMHVEKQLHVGSLREGNEFARLKFFFFFSSFGARDGDLWSGVNISVFLLELMKLRTFRSICLFISTELFVVFARHIC